MKQAPLDNDGRARTSHDIAAQKRAAVLSLFPEARTESGTIDFERLRRLLGDTVDSGKERFGLSWSGKADCFRAIAAPSMATLLPLPEQSVAFETSENLILEGDNLEVLKLLQPSYRGAIKMIYIDPPYNSGNDVIYPDDFAESLQTYLAYSGQADDRGRKFGTNTESDGRFHSKWLSMMYPRLYLARNLLRDDGVIFVSIDDTESHHLRALLGEIFGEENYLVTLYVQVRFAQKTLAERNDFQKLIEQVIVFRKTNAFRPKKTAAHYSLAKFEWNIELLADGRTQTIGGKTVQIFLAHEYRISKTPPSIDSLKATWATGTILKANASGKFFGEHLAPRKASDGLGVLYRVNGIGDDGLGFRYFTGPKDPRATKGKFFSGVPLFRREELARGSSLKESPIVNLLDYSQAFGNCRHEGGVSFRSGKKPIAFLKQLITMAAGRGDLILDFFAGSGSTAHAVLDLNEEDGGNRKFILVQLPEPTQENNCQNVFEITTERVRRVIAKIEDEARDADAAISTTGDRGFRAFRLAPSNVNQWRAGVLGDVEALEQELASSVDRVRADRSDLDLVFEVMLNTGFPPSAKAERQIIEGKPIFSVSGGALLICLDRKLNRDLIHALTARRPQRVLCLDQAFAGDDALKLDAMQTFRDHNIIFTTL